MSPMRTTLRLLALLGAVALSAGAASAATIGFVPGDQTVLLGDPVEVDVVISDLGGEIVSAYDLDITYDAGILSATEVIFGPGLGDPSLFEVFEDFDLSAPGLVDLAQLSLLSDAALLALQGGDSVTLATIRFASIGVGTTSLDFVFDSTNDVKGSGGQILDVLAEPGSVKVENPIPEPTAALVFCAGLLVLSRRLRASRS